MMADEIDNWYEANLPTQERKTRGHFSTPPLLVERILTACGYQPDRNLLQLRVLDPACGSGNFLTAVTQRMIASAQQQRVSATRLVTAVQRNIWGFDPDPVACFLAEMHLRAQLAEGLGEATARVEQVAGHLPLHIHQADALAFPWEQYEGIDLLLANPPYLAAKNSDLSGYRFARQRGQADSYLLFLDLALHVVRPGGWIGLVLPDPVLARANATRERRRLLESMTVHQLWHLAEVFPAYVGAIVLIAQKRVPARLHRIVWMRGQWHAQSGSIKSIRSERESVREARASSMQQQSVSQALLRQQPRAELRYLLESVDDGLIGRLYEYAQREDERDGLLSLDRLVTIRRGEELAKGNKQLRPQPEEGEENWYPVLRGGSDIRPYSLPVAQHWIARSGIVKPMRRYLTPKLLVVKSTGSLRAVLDTQGHVVLQTLYTLNWQHQELEGEALCHELYFLLALLNSRLLSRYVYVLYTAYKWVQPQIEQHVLAHLPIPMVSPEKKSMIVEMARGLERACSSAAPVVELKRDYQQLYEEQERAICALYEAILKRK